MNKEEAYVMEALLDPNGPVTTDRLRALAELSVERERQDGKFPEQKPGEGMARFQFSMLATLVEEVGEVAKAELEGDVEGLRRELVHVAAVAVKALEIEYELARLHDTPEAKARRREADALFNVGPDA